jgi:retinol dehydrogenase-12
MANENTIVLITGATDGVGKQTALQLAEKGYHIVMMVRSKTRAEQTRKEITAATGNKQIDYILADLTSLAQVRQAAAEFNAKYPKLDILINNAGLLVPKKNITADGFEQSFEVNHLSQFLLTHLLLDKLKLSPQGRIINLSSEGHRIAKFDPQNFNAEKGYDSMQQYCFTKLCNVYFTNELAERLKNTAITVNAVHPGVVRSSFAADMSAGLMKVIFAIMRPFMITVEKGAATSVYAATAPELSKVTGRYFKKSKESKSSTLSHDLANQKLLWEYSMKKVGLK